MSLSKLLTLFVCFLILACVPEPVDLRTNTGNNSLNPNGTHTPTPDWGGGTATPTPGGSVDCNTLRPAVLSAINTACQSCHMAGGQGASKFTLDNTGASLKQEMNQRGGAAQLLDYIVSNTHPGKAAAQSLIGNDRATIQTVMEACL